MIIAYTFIYACDVYTHFWIEYFDDLKSSIKIRLKQQSQVKKNEKKNFFFWPSLFIIIIIIRKKSWLSSVHFSSLLLVVVVVVEVCFCCIANDRVWCWSGFGLMTVIISHWIEKKKSHKIFRTTKQTNNTRSCRIHLQTIYKQTNIIHTHTWRTRHEIRIS